MREGGGRDMRGEDRERQEGEGKKAGEYGASFPVGTKSFYRCYYMHVWVKAGLAEQTSVISAYLGCSVGIDTLQIFAQLSDGLAARLDPIVQILLALAERLDVLALLEARDRVSVFEEDS